MTKGKLLFILIIVGLFAYLSSLGNPFIWDDEQFITSNSYVQNFAVGKILTTNTVAGAGVQSNYYRPLTSLSFALDKSIWGQNTFGFHLTNTSLHLLAGVLLFLFLSEIGIGTLFAFWVALFFLIHPVQVEAVSYINSRGDSLFAALLFAALYSFVLGLHRKKNRFFALSFFCFALSVLAKETALAGIFLFPGIVLLESFRHPEAKTKDFKILRYTQNDRLSEIFSKRAAWVTFGFMTSFIVLYSWLRLTVLNFANTLNFYNAQNLYTSHLSIRLFTFAKILWIYLGILLFPYPLHMERDTALVISFFNGWVIGSLLLIAAVVFLGIVEVRKKRTGFILFGFLFSSALLLPVSGIVPINGLLYEHWLYLPMIGFLIIVFRTGQLLFGSWFKRQWFRYVLTAIGIILASTFVILTIRQNNIWSDPIQFYSYTLGFAKSARLENNLAMSYAAQKDYGQAVGHYERSIALDDRYPQTHYNLANDDAQLGRYLEAEKEYKEALALTPDFGLAKKNLIILYLQTKQFDKALELSNNNPEVRKIIEQLKQ